MSVIRVNKTKNYTVMSNFHLRDKRLSAKAIGVMSVMLSLPDDWDYTIGGLTKIIKDGRGSIAGALQELVKCGYLKREQKRVPSGTFGEYIYTLYEEPQTNLPKAVKPKAEKPIAVNPKAVNPRADEPKAENPSQLNTDRRSTDKQSTERQNTDNAAAAAEGAGENMELSEVVKAFENGIHPIANLYEKDALLDLFDKYKKEWCIAAIKEAALNNGRSIHYVQSILERWERDGFKSKKRKDKKNGVNTGSHRKADGETETDRLLREKERRDAERIERWAREGDFSA